MVTRLPPYQNRQSPFGEINELPEMMISIEALWIRTTRKDNPTRALLPLSAEALLALF